MKKLNERGLAHALMIFLVIAWGFDYVAAKWALELLPPGSLMFFKFVLGLVFVWLIKVVVHKKWFVRKKDIPIFIACAIFGQVCYYECEYNAMALMPVALISIVLAFVPAVSIVLERIIYKRKANGKIYGAFVIRDPKERKNGKRGLVRVWDENLNPIDEAWFDEPLDGICVIGDTIYVGVDKWGHNKHPLCCIKRLGLDLSDKGNVDIDLGYEIHYGVQTMATDGKDLFLGNYGGTSRVSADLKTNTKIEFKCSEGFDLVPKSISKREVPVFFRVRAMGGNMQGWRKDPTNNPPRIQICFSTYENGRFTDITKP